MRKCVVKILNMQGYRLAWQECFGIWRIQSNQQPFVLCNQIQQWQREKNHSFFKYMLILQTFLITSLSKDLWWKSWQTITPDKNGQNMGVHHFTSARDDMQRKLIDKQGRKSITDEVIIGKFLNNIPHIITQSITHHLTNNMTHNDIVPEEEEFVALNRCSHAAHTKAGYYSKLSRCPHATSTRLSYPALQPRPATGQLPQYCVPSPVARSTASTETKDPDWDKIRKISSKEERLRRVHEEVSLCCVLAVHMFKECRKPLKIEPIRTAA